MTQRLLGYLFLSIFAFASGAEIAPSPCPFQQTLVPFSDRTSLGYSAEDLLSNLVTVSLVTNFNWANGETTLVNLEFIPQFDVAIEMISLGDNCYTEPSKLLISGTLFLRTEDAKINASWPAELFAPLLLESTNFSAELHLLPLDDDLQGFPGRAEGDAGSGTHFYLKFRKDQIDGLIMRYFSVPAPTCPPYLEGCFIGGQDLIATIGAGVGNQ